MDFFEERQAFADFVGSIEHVLSDNFRDLGEDIFEYLLTREKEEKEKMSPLIQTDYTLNSPLIRDKVDALLDYLQTKVPDLRFRDNKNFREAFSMCSDIKVNWRDFSASKGFHAWLAQAVFQRHLKSHNLLDRLRSFLEEGRECIQVVKDFWKGLTGLVCGEEPDHMKADILHRSLGMAGHGRMMDDLEAFWFFHRSILIMNSLSDPERQNICKSDAEDLGLSVKTGDRFAFRVSGYHQDFGEFCIVPGYLILLSEKRILDRNMVLMLKDTLIGRFCVKISLISREDGMYNRDTVIKVTQLFERGDLLLQRLDNRAFDHIKLVEAHCCQRTSELAARHRPLVPLNHNLREHLTKKINELDSIAQISSKPLFELILSEEDHHVVRLYYGCHRLWGHPFLDYFEGLSKLKTQTTLEKSIDIDYVNLLASDLAYIVLHDQFRKRKEWFVDSTQMDESHPLLECVRTQVWPTPAVIQDFGDHWHELPLTQCFDVPETIDPAVLYDDKSHSINRNEVIEHVKSSKTSPIPSKKVLATVLEEPQTHVPSFLKDVDKKGLNEEDYAIGLKGKEREVKREGRFFSLMTKRMREYFVITEYLIKLFYVPLFLSLTMADDMTSVISKLMDSSIGQGNPGYETIGFANHLDYSSWNNHQRLESNGPVFRVMGQFFGLPLIFWRTHEIFQKSLIYYNDRPDLMEWNGRELQTKPGAPGPVCWNGQAGGLEGLRQKGWSIVNLLVIMREGKVRNTLIRTLAQGDNQVICTRYKIPSCPTSEELREHLTDAYNNNNYIMRAIEEGTKKLGLIINHDEVLTSADFMVYGKIPLYRGNLEIAEGKRWARTTCVTNDQIPALGSLMACVSTAALTVAQFSNSILDPMFLYVWFGWFVLVVLEYHCPLLQDGRFLSEFPAGSDTRKIFFLRSLFTDPSLGGISGTSLTRFLVRDFPDPVTESLSFWRHMHKHSTSVLVKKLALEAGSPKLAKADSDSFVKLLEKPTSLNLPKGLSAATLVRNEVRQALINRVGSIRNPLFSHAISYLRENTVPVQLYLQSITPLFPRFTSEFSAATFLGLTESLVGLFQNSRTMRKLFSVRFSEKVGRLLRLSELSAIKYSLAPFRIFSDTEIWECSSSRADLLRHRSWGQPIIGTTIPHPLEYLSQFPAPFALCVGCETTSPWRDYISVTFPHGFSVTNEQKGPLGAYLGSKTSEATTLFQPWEKELRLPLIRRAAKMRNSIHWFVKPMSNVAKSILNNLKALTGEDWTERTTEYERTGCALHRFHCSRQSSGGFTSVSPAILTYVMVTADTCKELSKGNYDFMYQASLLYSQLVSCEINHHSRSRLQNFHFHIKCPSCIRPVSDIYLDSPYSYEPPDESETIRQMSGTTADWSTARTLPSVRVGNWDDLSLRDQCFHVGLAQGALFGFLSVEDDHEASDASLFPYSVLKGVLPHPYLSGVLQGIMMAAAYQAAFHRQATSLKNPTPVLRGAALFIIDRLSLQPAFQSLCNDSRVLSVLTNSRHKVPASYPPTAGDLGAVIKSYFVDLMINPSSNPPTTHQLKHLWLFSDFRTPRLSGLMILTHRILSILRMGMKSRDSVNELSAIKRSISYYCSDGQFTGHSSIIDTDGTSALIGRLISHVHLCTSETRHALYRVIRIPETGPMSLPSSDWGPEFCPSVQLVKLELTSEPLKVENLPALTQVTDPLISGLRLVQLATGSHYKIRGLLGRIEGVRDAIVGGDGSGGISSCILRMFPKCRVIFNSLLELNSRHLRGVAPGPPSAIACLPDHMQRRCVNLHTCWADPSDLSRPETWANFHKLVDLYHLRISLMVFDMEVRSDEMSLNIVRCLRGNLHTLLSHDGSVIFKTYGTSILKNRAESLNMLATLFEESFLGNTSLTSSQSSELYFIGKRLHRGRIERPFVSTSSCSSALRMTGVWQGVSAEFERACSITPGDLEVGVPSSLIVDSSQEVTHMLVSVGLESGLAFDMGFVLGSCQCVSIDPMATILTILAVTSNSLLNVTRWQEGKAKVPSDQRLYRLLNLIIGSWMYVAWFYRNESWHIEALQLARGPIEWRVRLWTLLNSGNLQSSISWNFFGTGHILKKLPRTDSYAQIASTIRMWARAFKQHTPPGSLNWGETWKMVERLATVHNSGLTANRIRGKTGLVAFLKDEFPRIRPDHPAREWLDSLDSAVLTVEPNDDEETGMASWRG